MKADGLRVVLLAEVERLVEVAQDAGEAVAQFSLAVV